MLEHNVVSNEMIYADTLMHNPSFVAFVLSSASRCVSAYAEIASYCDITPYHGKVVAIDIVAHKQVRTSLPAGPRASGRWNLGTRRSFDRPLL